jgi:hypothetical protein
MNKTNLSSAPPRRASLVQKLFRACKLGIRLLGRRNTYKQLPTLLTKSLAPIGRIFVTRANNGKLAQLIKERAVITFVSSYPRSGNTWMRFLLSDIILQNQGAETTTDLAQPGKIVPDYYNDFITPKAKPSEQIGYLVKTHDMVPVLGERIGDVEGLRQCRFLYLFRSAEDVLVSLFHYTLCETYINSNSGGNIDLFCLEYLPSWKDNLASYLDEIERGTSIYIISYEELVRQPTLILSDALHWLGIPFTTANVERAESNMQFGKLQARQDKNYSGGSKVFRRGVQGSGASELKPETVAQIRAETQDLMARAQACLARQASRPRSARDMDNFFAAPHLRNGHAEVVPASNVR